jgi:hypothetical protein
LDALENVTHSLPCVFFDFAFVALMLCVFVLLGRSIIVMKIKLTSQLFPRIVWRVIVDKAMA